MKATERSASREISFVCCGRPVTVRRNEGHPEGYLYIELDDATFFLGVAPAALTRGDVKRMATAWMESRQTAQRGGANRER